MAQDAVIIGGTGQIGRAVVNSLVADGWTVTTFDRGRTAPPADWAERGVRQHHGDREDDAALAAVLSRGADLVVDTIAYDEPHARQLLAHAGNVGGFVVISSASVYADAAGRTLDEATGVDDFPRFGGPIPESGPTVAPGPATYSTRKVRLERALLDDGTAPVTVLRPCAIHGPGSGSPREWWPLLRALDRRPAIPLAHNGASRFHTTSVANLAELVRLAARQPAARVLNGGDPAPPTVAEIVAAVCATTDHQPERVPFAGPAAVDGPTAGAGRSPWAVPFPLVVDMAAAERDLGYVPVTSYADAVWDTCRWLREITAERPWREALPLLATHYGDRMDNYAAEDALLDQLAETR